MKDCFSPIVWNSFTLYSLKGDVFFFEESLLPERSKNVIHALLRLIPSLLRLLLGDQLSVNFDSSRNLADKAKFFSYEQTY